MRWLQRQTSVVLGVITVEELAYGMARAPAAQRPKLARWLDEVLDSAGHRRGRPVRAVKGVSVPVATLRA